VIAPQRNVPSQDRQDEIVKATGMLAWTSFGFAILQSICGFFAAVSGLRLLIGITSLAISASVATKLDAFHADRFRIPMLVFAFVGALLNLIVLFQIRRLRARPASQWRQRPMTKRTLRMERLQFALSIATIILVAIEEYLHFGHAHNL
jgi:hypothetical protein